MPLILQHTLPLAGALVDELFPFWATIFGEAQPDVERPVFLGAEEAENRGVTYTTRVDGQVAGACLLIQSRRVPALAGLGAVGTAPELRGQGLATALCGQALADFQAAGGEALFLGTNNPDAARIYRRLGWRKLAGADVMANLTDGRAPEEFLVDFFRRPGAVTIEPLGPAARLPMIPLLLTPHDHQVLDANVALASCRYRTQSSCLGLYMRYIRSLSPRGAGWAACTTDGRVVGLATARFVGGTFVERIGQIDGFVHHNFAPVWPDLITTARNWALDQGATRLRTVLSVEDEEKQAQFAALGFSLGDDAYAFRLDAQPVLMRWMWAAV